MSPDRFPTFMIAHGGGPCFFMDPRAGETPGLWDEMAAHLRNLDANIGRRPDAVLVISAHWECDVPTVHGAAAPTLLYDYFGFPDHTYRLTYPVQGAPAVGARVQVLLQAADIESAVEYERGLDHGVFIPFKLIYPDADVPIVQLSLRTGLNATEHLEMGRALAPLRDEGVLIVGSGMTFHNRSLGFSDAAVEAGTAFDTWLNHTVGTDNADARWDRLARWSQAPGGRQAHVREEHLLPLMVAAGAAGADPGRSIYAERFGGRVPLSGFRFG
jgi:aromatic ring-opening dioxygenase catalytic subunit (LigB family)